MIQVWDQKSDQSVRSPALGENDLQKKFGKLEERVFYDLKLPDGSRVRAVGVLIHPNVEHPETNVAHELRTPLANVHFIIEQALRRPREKEDYRRRFALAQEGTEGLNTLVNRLMKIWYGQAKGIYPRVMVFQMATAVRVPMLRESFRKGELALLLHCD